MLTITTSKDEIAEIAAGEKSLKALPLTDFWEKRIINILGFSDSDAREIIHNLREDRKGTTDAEREVRLTAGGAASIRVMATFKIGRLNPDAAETFVMTIKNVLEIAGLPTTGTAVEVVEAEIVDEPQGNPNAPAVRVMGKFTGFCRYCHQARIVEAPEGLSGEAYNDYATAECDCKDAQEERRKHQKMEAAGLWAKNMFSQSDGQLQLVLCSIRATFDGEVDYCTIKIGKRTHKIDRDGDGMIRIKTTFRDSNEETF